MMHIDYPRYKARFRSACARRGIDPARGATVYQAANARAEQRCAPLRHRWWLDATLWEDAPPHHSPVEFIVLRMLYDQASYYTLYRMAEQSGAAMELSFEELLQFNNSS
jgi:hypothetical protein